VGRRVLRQGRDVGEHILARRYIRDDVGHRYHPRAGVRRIVRVRSAADARLVVDQLPTDVPRVEAGELRRVDAFLRVALALRAVARRADRKHGPARGRVADGSGLRLRKRRLLREPRLIGGRLVYYDLAAHRKVPGAAQLLAENLVSARYRRLEPLIGDETRNEVHFHAELRDREVVQDVGRAQPRPDVLADGEMQDRAGDDDVVLPLRILGIDAERIVDVHVPH